MNKLLNVLTPVMVFCAVVVSGTIVWREFAPPNRQNRNVERKPVEVKTWRQVAAQGTRFGGENAQIVITQVSDFQCPYCRRFHEVLTRIEQKYPTDVAFVYRHFPLNRIHPHARAAALASECAGRLGKFREYYDVLFVRQDSIADRG